jgi:4-hydroxybenzoate polyprenyltransferase
MKSILKLIFLGNYFIGLLAIALSIESNVQLRLPLNSVIYYIILFSATVFYYTYAYIGPLYSKTSVNPRTKWYRKNHSFILWSQRTLITLVVVLGAVFLVKHFKSIVHLDILYWVILFIMMLSAFFYYGLLPRSFYKINLRNTGWLKAFVIGFVWACCANLLSFIVLQVEKGQHNIDPVLLLWLFIKNWMFCTVNAIMFDIKDYAHDSNKELKTFVVRYGLRRTIYFILLPLIVIGLFSLVAFATARNFEPVTIGINLIPFILLLMIAWSMLRPHKIMYYLIVIDGLIFLKALCGIAGMQFIH